jgi:hypothetical protein
MTPVSDKTVEVLRLHPLTYLAEGDEVVVGRKDVDSYGLFPTEGADLVRQLEAGRSVTAAAGWYEDTYGEPIDMVDFVDTLRELDFVVTGQDGSAVPAPTVPWGRLGRVVFSRPAWACYLALVAAVVAICVTDRRFVPSRGHIFFSSYLLVIEVVLGVAQIPLMLVHESFHMLAGRRLGLNSSLRLSRRLYFLTFETALDGLVIVPRRRRYLPMLAGLVADVLVMCVFMVVAWLAVGPNGELSFVSRLFLALAFTTLPRIVWQFYFFLRTDIYYLVVTVLGCVDLHTTTRQMLRNRLWGLLKRPERKVDESRWHPRDVAVARWYLPLHVSGYAVVVAATALITLPLTWRFMHTAAGNALGSHAPAGQRWDAALFVAVTVAQFGVSALLAARDRRRRRAVPAPA